MRVGQAHTAATREKMRAAWSEPRRAKMRASKLGAGNPTWVGNAVCYTARHQRLQKVADHICIDCAKPARHWSLRRDAEGPLVAEAVGRYKGFMYSVGPDSDYVPRCVPCHKEYDHPMNPTPRHLRPERQAYMREYRKRAK